MTNDVILLTHQNFDKYFKSPNLLVIDFWAPWCEPCKDFSRLFDEIAKETTQKICFASVNVDEEKSLAQDFSIKSVPTLAIIKNQVMVFHQSGAIPKSALQDLLQKALALPDIAFA